jgi:hypothetical protein
MDVAAILKIPLPSPTESFFDRILTMGWYDGITDGLVCGPSGIFVFRFDILAWGPGQDQRVFALSPITIAIFDEVVKLLGQLESPKWPRWDVGGWPADLVKLRRLNQDLDQILTNAEKPSLVMETESMFKTIYGVRLLSGDSMNLMPDQFDGQPHLDNYDYWHSYLGLSA